MATVTITVPDALVSRLTAAMRAQYPQYSALGDAAAFRRVTADHWRDVLAAFEGTRAADIAYPGYLNAHQAAAAQARTDAAGIT
jgi:hypothetical protein